MTLRWPHHTPQLADVPLDLPDGWTQAATEHCLMLVFGGYGLGLHEDAGNGPAHLVEHLPHVAESVHSPQVLLRSPWQARP